MTLDDALDLQMAGQLASAALRRVVFAVRPPAPVALCPSGVAALIRWVQRGGGERLSVQAWERQWYAGTNGSYVLRQLTAAGLVTDAPDPHDRRRRLIRPTSGGRAYAQALIAAWGGV